MTEEKTKTIYEKIQGERRVLTDQKLNYESTRLNPILTPIAEAQIAIQNFDEMISKISGDVSRDYNWIIANEALIPKYTTSIFVSRLFKLRDELGDLIKLMDIENDMLRDLIKKMIDMVMLSKLYMVAAENKKIKAEDKILKKMTSEEYLQSLSSTPNEDARKLVDEVLQVFLNTKHPNDAIRLDRAIMAVRANNLANKQINTWLDMMMSRDNLGGEK